MPDQKQEIEEAIERSRRFYTITAAGRRQLATEKAEWDRTASIMHTLLRDQP